MRETHEFLIMPTDQRRPFPLFALLTAQFFGAFNDNAYKMIVILLGLAAVQGADEASKQGVTTLAMVVLTAPLMLGSLPAMILGDRVSKRSLIVWTKFAELSLMALGTYALWAQPDGWLPYVVLGRALYHHARVAGRTHADRGALRLAEDPDGENWADRIPRDQRNDISNIRIGPVSLSHSTAQ